jgi:hypothetical protein
MPMTGPRTFLSLSSENLANEELNGLLYIFADLVAEDVARGSCFDGMISCSQQEVVLIDSEDLQLLSILRTTYLMRATR